MIFAAEPRRLFVVCPKGRSHVVLGWSSTGNRVTPVVACSTSATPITLDAETLAASRYLLEDPNERNQR